LGVRYGDLTSEQEIEAYNTDYQGTGYSVGSIKDGLPTRVITDEMIKSAVALMPDWFQSEDKPKLTDFYNIGEDGSIALNEAGQALLEAAEAQEKLVSENKPSSEPESPSTSPSNSPIPGASSDTLKNFKPSSTPSLLGNEITIGGKTYSLQGTNYSIDTLS